MNDHTPEPEETDPTPDEQWQVTGWQPNAHQSYMDAWESAQELRS